MASSSPRARRRWVGWRWDGRFSGPYDSSCGLPGRYVLSVTRTQIDGPPDTALPVELGYLAEPPIATDVSTLPAPQPTSVATPLTPDITAAPQTVVGRGSYGAAAALAGSGTYTDTIRPGETLFYRVKLDWVQRLAYAVRFHAGRDALNSGVGVDSWIGNPARIAVARAPTAGTTARTSRTPRCSRAARSRRCRAGRRAPPVRAYRNRESDLQSVWDLRLAGYYYLVVTMDNGRDPTDAEIPVDLAVRVDGKAMDAPAYQHLKGTSDPGDLGLPGQGAGGSLLRKVAMFSGGALALSA